MRDTMRGQLLAAFGCLTLFGCGIDHKGRDSFLADTNGPENTFEFTYHNHQWNAFDISLPGMSIRIDTPTGDDANPSRNAYPGYRPILRYNQFSVATANKTVRKALWQDEPNAPKNGQVHCKSLVDLVDVATATFPIKVGDLLSAFRIEAMYENKSCSLNIEKPSEIPGENGYASRLTDDQICLFSPQALVGEGPQFIAIYAPYRYSKKPIDFYLNEWPQEQIKVCVDGTLHTVKDRNPPSVFPDPTPSPTPGPTPTPPPVPDFLETLDSLENALQLAHDAGTIKGIKYLFDRKEDKAYFQNTKRFEYHLPFINQFMSRFNARLTAQDYDKLLFAPMPKELTGGEIYWAGGTTFPGTNKRGVLGFSTYYRERPDVAEIVTTLKKLSFAAPFAKKRTLYVFEQEQDFTRYGNELRSAGVVSLPIGRLNP